MVRLSDPDPVQIALLVGGILEQLGIRYLLGGSLASVAFGEPRATLDVDLAVDLSEASARAFLGSVRDEFLVDEEWAQEEVAKRGSFQMVHRESVIRVDVFVPPWEGLHAWKWLRRQRVELSPGGDSLYVTSPEGIVLQKLVWYRSGGQASDRQWRDVLGVLKAQGRRMDLGETQMQAEVAGVADLLKKAVEDAGLT